MIEEKAARPGGFFEKIHKQLKNKKYEKSFYTVNLKR